MAVLRHLVAAAAVTSALVTPVARPRPRTRRPVIEEPRVDNDELTARVEYDNEPRVEYDNGDAHRYHLRSLHKLSSCQGLQTWALTSVPRRRDVPGSSSAAQPAEEQPASEDASFSSFDGSSFNEARPLLGRGGGSVLAKAAQSEREYSEPLGQGDSLAC